ncbi:hypothetical protein LTR56_016653 [Elasticomyces elasticus]|nr:hypothetical protein LTR56_016653 [Elasticomyces elasticus]KAK3641549.1 hypothetical protein LTR22_016550 [Elasticomyces elasticus]KAK4921946.1 hypothetical protein LTR49_010719 [Elasticomyces elasticus]KAK5758159.1 hypothetical protein LTS12_011775 [Elasticomyces elasticus]
MSASPQSPVSAEAYLFFNIALIDSLQQALPSFKDIDLGNCILGEKKTPQSSITTSVARANTMAKFVLSSGFTTKLASAPATFSAMKNKRSADAMTGHNFENGESSESHPSATRPGRRSATSGKRANIDFVEAQARVSALKASTDKPSPSYFRRERGGLNNNGFNVPVMKKSKRVSIAEEVAQDTSDHGTAITTASRLRDAPPLHLTSAMLSEDEDSDEGDPPVSLPPHQQSRSIVGPHDAGLDTAGAIRSSNTNDKVNLETVPTATSAGMPLTALQTATDPAVAVILNLDTRKSIGKAKPRKGLRPINDTAPTRDATPPTQTTPKAVIDLTGDSEGMVSPSPNYVHAEDRSASVGLGTKRSAVVKFHGDTSVTLPKKTLTGADAIKLPRRKPAMSIKKETDETRTAEPDRQYRKVEWTTYSDQQNELAKLRKANAEMTATISKAKNGDRIQAQHEANKIWREKLRLRVDVHKMLGLLEELENQKRMLCDDQMALTWEDVDDQYRATIRENIATGQEIVDQTRACFDTAAQAVARAVEYQTKYDGGLGMM